MRTWPASRYRPIRWVGAITLCARGLASALSSGRPPAGCRGSSPHGRGATPGVGRYVTPALAGLRRVSP